MIEASGKSALWVGVFVILAGAAGAALLFFFGGAERIFSRPKTLVAEFADVGGLREGASVRLAGVEIGSVSRVGLTNEPKPRARIEMEIRPQAFARLRADASAILMSAGLLGDRIVLLQAGHAAEALPAGATLIGRMPPDPADVVQRAGETADNVLKMADHVNEAINAAMPHFVSSAEDLHRFTTRLERGPGLLHDLAFDASLSQKLRASLEELHRATASVAQTSTQVQQSMHEIQHATQGVDQIVAHVRSGRGTLGGLIYDPAIYESIRQVAGSVQRSVLLRALVRYSIKRGEQNPPRPPESPTQRVRGREDPLE